MKHVIVLGAQVPFVRGGAELLNDSLVREINKLDGYTAELVQLPFKWYPESQMFNDINAWGLLDISESAGKKIDLVIATKFPTYAIKHSNVVLWLVHQHRVLYDLEGTKWDVPNLTQADIDVRSELRKLDTQLIARFERPYTISQNVTDRLMAFNNIRSEVLFPPAPFADKVSYGDYGDYILCIGRLEPIKRPDLLIQALSKASSQTKAVFIGKGPMQESMQKQIAQLALSERCQVLGYVEENVLVQLLANCRAVFYAPVDEDYGYATIEAFLAKKPVITCVDSGEVRNMVVATGAGFVCGVDEADIGNAINKVYELTSLELENMSWVGYNFAKSITWDHVLKKLVIGHA